MRTLALSLLFLQGMIGAATAQATVQISEQDCSQLARHVAANDVAYQPGVDVSGNAVAPADLEGSGQITMPETVIIPLTLDLASRLGIPPEGNADYLARPVIGDVAIGADGRVTFNGMPLTSEAQHELAQKCQRVGAAR